NLLTLSISLSSVKRDSNQLYVGTAPSHLYIVPTKVPYHPLNYRIAAAIGIRVVSRYGKVSMRYWMKPLTAPPGGKRWS
ncbi:hypothetical protein AVEN_30096-1, partial [Araneus ventricosus]